MREHPVSEVVQQLRGVQRKQVWNFIQTVFNEWSDDKAPRLGAALAFYTALSIAPLLVVVLAIAGVVYGQKAVQGQLVWQIQGYVGSEGAKAIQALIASAHRPSSGVIATILGLITLFFGASSAFAELSDALNTIWRVPPDPALKGFASIMDMMKRRTLSLLMVLGAGLFLVLSIFVAAWIAVAQQFFRGIVPTPGGVMVAVDFAVSYMVTTVVFAVVYKVLPDVKLKWSDVAVGAAITALLFTIGKYFIGFYLARTSIASSYGAVGSFMVVLLWVYYSAQVFFVGAEFTKIYTLRFGSHFRAKLELKPGDGR